MPPDASHPADPDLSDELPAGAALLKGQYVIQKTLNSGGFGITYLASDASNREVVIKECFPGSHCRRQKSRVLPRNSGGQSEMARILRHFLKEARSLATMDHPNIVHVHQVFQENDTAYMALDHIRGSDLLHLVQMGHMQRGSDWVVALTVKLVQVLDYVHRNDILHRDISPDNIFVSSIEEPVLIDFGAASWLSDTGSNDVSQLMVVKDGYSPYEFYYSGGSIGPWSDIYSLGATLYFTITGKAPVSSQTRIAALAEKLADPLPGLVGTVTDYDSGFLATIDKALSVLPGQRYQSAAEWLADLEPYLGQKETAVKLIEKAFGLKRPTRPDRVAPAANRPDSMPAGNSPQAPEGRDMALDITALNEINGFIGGCLVDSETGLMMAAVGGGKLDLEAASAANTEVVRAKNQAIRVLGLNDSIEDILITLGKQFHLIRPIEKTPTVFLYVALDRKVANLGLARVQVKKVEQTLAL